MTSSIPKLHSNQTDVPPQERASVLAEIFPASSTDAGVMGFILAHLQRSNAPVLWVQDRLSRKEAGVPYLPGMGGVGIILVTVTRAVDVLWALEEGLRCKALSAVVGELWGEPPALSFTATKRLALRAEASDLPCWLIRRASAPNLSAARERWRIASLPSGAHPHDAQSPGSPRWKAELFRSRTGRPGSWVASYDREADRLHFTAPLRDRALAAGDGAARRRAT